MRRHCNRGSITQGKTGVLRHLVSLSPVSFSTHGPHRAIVEVAPDDRVLQILAGPGSGKTEMLVRRVLYDLVARRTPAEQIVVTTFTRRAATELQVRVVERRDEFLTLATKRGVHLGDPQVHNLRIGTIHSLCDSFLAEFDSAYMEAGTQLIDEAESTVRLARDFRFALGQTGRQI